MEAGLGEEALTGALAEALAGLRGGAAASARASSRASDSLAKAPISASAKMEAMTGAFIKPHNRTRTAATTNRREDARPKPPRRRLRHDAEMRPFCEFANQNSRPCLAAQALKSRSHRVFRQTRAQKEPVRSRVLARRALRAGGAGRLRRRRARARRFHRANHDRGTGCGRRPGGSSAVDERVPSRAGRRRRTIGALLRGQSAGEPALRARRVEVKAAGARRVKSGFGWRPQQGSNLRPAA